MGEEDAPCHAEGSGWQSGVGRALRAPCAVALLTAGAHSTWAASFPGRHVLLQTSGCSGFPRMLRAMPMSQGQHKAGVGEELRRPGS